MQSAGVCPVWVSPVVDDYEIHLHDLRPPAFVILVQNGGGAPLDLGPRNVTATSGGKAVTLLVRAKFVAAVNRSADLQIHKVKDSTDAAPLENVPGKWVLTSDDQGSSYEPPEVDAVPSYVLEELDAKAKLMTRAIERMRGLYLDQAKTMLETQRIAPGSSGGGVVMLRPREIVAGEVLVIRVDVGSESHEFLFDVTN